ncbi:DUF551 domain-containing protein [Salmonella enterica subsp. enterica serovar Give]|nr:DUF551 domain-containing protein [Salmonella enterica subsp. enterica serovar Give]EIT4365701.1 DUF551 domain-containing protein [Salmonella enterica subsp. enterica serovar Give]
MSNIDKQAVQSVADLKAGYTLGHADVAILNELARIAMASLEAEPVAWTSEETLAEVFCDETGVIGPQYMVGNIPLYLHAQHAPVVPDEMPLHTGPREFGRPQAYVDGWNACRAAMLQGAEPVTTAYKLPDGWVACSERMPEDTQMVLAFSHGEIVAAYWNYVMCPIEYKKYRAFTYLSGSLLEGVTHWMPMPAAPQQEAKNV